MTDGAGHVSTRAYDAAGDQIILTNRNGNPWHFQFDGARRLTNTITPLGRSTTVAFNQQGLVSSKKDPSGRSTSYGYDAKGHLTSRPDPVGATGFSYNGDNNRLSAGENGLTNFWTYDAYTEGTPPAAIPTAT
jgi:YD repeat-containing protein